MPITFIVFMSFTHVYLVHINLYIFRYQKVSRLRDELFPSLVHYAIFYRILSCSIIDKCIERLSNHIVIFSHCFFS